MFAIHDTIHDDATLTLDVPEDAAGAIVLNVTADGPGGYAAGAGLYLTPGAALALAHALTDWALPHTVAD